MRLAVVTVALIAAAMPANARPGSVVRVEYHDPAAPPSIGPADAPVTVELFFVPWLQSRSVNYRYLQALAAKHPNRLRLVYRVLEANGQALLPAAALEAEAEGKFDAFMEAINAEHAQISRARLFELAAKVGLDDARLDDAITKHNPALDYNARRLQRFPHRSSPDVLFNGLPPLKQLGSLGQANLDEEYGRAYDRAMDLLDRGATPADLMDVFDAEALGQVVPDVHASGPTDENIENEPLDPPLANPPLDLRGLPSYGPANAPVPLVILCKPTSAPCPSLIAYARDVQKLYPDSVRIVWAPWYDTSQAAAADLALLSDAALCAEVVGTGDDSPLDEPSSSGWRWVEAVFADVKDRHNKTSAEETIGRVARRLRVDSHALAACRARGAGAAVARIEAERRSGLRASPSLVVGGRIYHGGVANKTSLQALVEAELAPGVLDSIAPAWPSRARSAQADSELPADVLAR
jgi:hypothetical protein